MLPFRIAAVAAAAAAIIFFHYCVRWERLALPVPVPLRRDIKPCITLLHDLLWRPGRLPEPVSVRVGSIIRLQVLQQEKVSQETEWSARDKTTTRRSNLPKFVDITYSLDPVSSSIF